MINTAPNNIFRTNILKSSGPLKYILLSFIRNASPSHSHTLTVQCIITALFFLCFRSKMADVPAQSLILETFQGTTVDLASRL